MKEKESASTSSGNTSGESTEYSFEFAPRAVRDVDDAVAWLTERSSRGAAEEWARTLHEKIRTLATFPERCPIAPESESFGEPIRQLLFGERRGQHRVLYSVRGPVIRIVTIRHAARGPLLESDDE